MRPSLAITPQMRYLKPRHVAEVCGVTTKTVTRWIAKGLLKADHTPTGQWRIEPSVVIAFAAEHKYGAPRELYEMADRVAAEARK